MKKKKITPYKVISLIILCVVAFTFVFPFYWIITGAFKSQSVAIALPPQWFPTEPTMANFEKLFKNPAWQWMLNTVLMALGSMLLVCGTAALCGYALAKKRFYGQSIVFGLIICAMALPKQVVLVPLVRMMASLRLRWLYLLLGVIAAAVIVVIVVTAIKNSYNWLTAEARRDWKVKDYLFHLLAVAVAVVAVAYLVKLPGLLSGTPEKTPMTDTLWAVILPTVGWPFGVFLMKQFSESIPGEILEATRIDGASEAKTFITVVLPMVKPGIGALAIFTFINSWNDYFMQLVMLPSGNNFTMPLGIASLQAETSIDMGLLMAGAALASVPIIVVFLMFQKYFTQGITMGAVKG